MTIQLDSLPVRRNLLNALFKQVTYTGPIMYMTVYGTDSGDEIAVPVRTVIEPDDWDVVTVGDSCHVENNSRISILEVTGATLNGVILFDAPTGGAIVLSAPFSAPLVVPDDATVMINTGQMTFTLDHP